MCETHCCEYAFKKAKQPLLIRIFVLPLQRLNQSNTTALEKKTRTLALTEKEYDLIQAIRDYRKSYIFSSRQIELYIETTLAELMAGEE